MALAWATDGIRNDRAVRVWEIQTGRELRHLEHSDAVTCVAFSPGGTESFSGSEDQTLLWWSHERSQVLMRYNGHSAGVTGLAVARTDASWSRSATTQPCGSGRWPPDGNTAGSHWAAGTPIPSPARSPCRRTASSSCGRREESAGRPRTPNTSGPWRNCPPCPSWPPTGPRRSPAASNSPPTSSPTWQNSTASSSSRPPKVRVVICGAGGPEQPDPKPESPAAAASHAKRPDGRRHPSPTTPSRRASKLTERGRKALQRWIGDNQSADFSMNRLRGPCHAKTARGSCRTPRSLLHACCTKPYIGKTQNASA